MKLSLAVAAFLITTTGLTAQKAAQPPTSSAPPKSPIIVPSAGALGGSYASVGISRPLGGITSPRQKPLPATGTRYFGPIYYVPGPSDYDSYYSQAYSSFNTPAAPAPAAPPPASTLAQPQPIIINQYFGTPAPAAPVEEAATSPNQPAEPAEPQYYLIAYKDHSVYTALAYWVEGDILHYVTTRNTHNQASLSLIDLDQTIRLNADSPTPFTLTPSPAPGK